MKILLAATATIQFVGLCMVTPGDPTAPVHVVLPRIEATAPAPAPTMEQNHAFHERRNDIQLVQFRGRYPASVERVPPQYPPQPEEHIDAHNAIIAFIGQPQRGSNWPYKTLKPAPQYNYVDLAGEHVRVLMSPSNGVPSVPAGLPSVRHGCTNQQRTLNADYKPPLYPKAAGVVRVTGGELNACTPTINGAPSSRVDTRWTFDTPGPIVIETTNHRHPKLKKQLILDPKEVVMIGNVPTPWLGSAPMQYSSALHNEAGHYRAFFRMLTGANDGCSHGRASASPCPGSVGFHAPPRGGGGKDDGFRTRYTAWREGAIEPGPTTLGSGCPVCMETYSCSNSQYP